MYKKYSTFRTNSFEEPLDVRTRHAFEGIETEAGVFNEDGTINVLGSFFAFLNADLIYFSLVLWQINTLADDLERILQQQ